MSASISNYFEELRTDVEGAYYGFYFMDLANYFAREANDETLLLKLLYQTFRALVNTDVYKRQIQKFTLIQVDSLLKLLRLVLQLSLIHILQVQKRRRISKRSVNCYRERQQ